jgi:HK97 gp10 family phage protein
MAVEGVAQLRAKLKALPDAAKNEIRAALEQNVEEIADFARRLVPVHQGDLRASIGWTFGAAPKGSMVLAQAESTEADLRVTVYAGNERAYYARWVEFGTVKMVGRPFFFPAYRAVKRRVRGRLTRATRKAAKAIAGKT